MKQRITVEQLAELTDEQKEKLREWWKPKMKDGDWFYGSYGGRGDFDEWILSPYAVDSGVYGASLDKSEDSAPDYNALPLLSIGQMIELLHKYVLNGEISIEYLDSFCAWRVKGNGLNEIWSEHYADENNYPVGNELCDALWEAVKIAL